MVSADFLGLCSHAVTAH